VNMKKIKIAVMPAMADLYKRLFDTETIKALDESVRNNINALKSELYDFDIAPVASSAQQIKQIAADFEKGGIDLLVIFLGPYCPSAIRISVSVTAYTPCRTRRISFANAAEISACFTATRVWVIPKKNLSNGQGLLHCWRH